MNLLKAMNKVIRRMYLNNQILNENLNFKINRKLSENEQLNIRELTIVQGEIKIITSNKDWWEPKMKEVKKKLKKKDLERKQLKQILLKDNKFRQKFVEIFERFRIQEKYLISYKDPRKHRFELFILALAFQSSLIVPLQLAFKPAVLESVIYVVWDNFVDGMFLLDLIGRFFTTYQNKSGTEEYNSVLIAYNYISNIRFLFDLFAILGNDAITKFSPNLKMFRAFKLSRIFRLGALIRNLNIPKEIKALLNLAKLTFFYYMLIHICGCGLYAVVWINKDSVDERGMSTKWVPPVDNYDYTDSKFFKDDTSLLY